MDVRAISIDDIGLSIRASNGLHRAGINTVGEMLTQTWESLMEIRSLGKKSVEEILQKIEKYKVYETEVDLPEPEEDVDAEFPDTPGDYSTWVQTDEGKAFCRSWLEEKGIKIDSLELLSARAYNYLLLNGYTGMHQITFMNVEDLMQIPRMDPQCAEEIAGRCRLFLEEKKDELSDLVYQNLF